MPGFTLIQQIITITVICLLCTFAYPNYSQLLQTQQALLASKTLCQCLQYARTYAIFHYTTTTLVLTKHNTGDYTIAIKDPFNTVKTYHFAKHLYLAWHGFGNNQQQITISALGLTNNNGHFTIKHRQHSKLVYTLFISKTLKISLTNHKQ